MELDSNNAISYTNLAGFYMTQGRFDEARATFNQALTHKFDGGDFRLWHYLLAFL